MYNTCKLILQQFLRNNLTTMRFWRDMVAPESNKKPFQSLTGVRFLSHTEQKDFEKQRQVTTSSPSIRGLLGRFWRCCWRCRLPGSLVCREWHSTGHHRDGMVCGGRTWQRFCSRHPCGQASLSEGRGSYLKEEEVNMSAAWFMRTFFPWTNN